MMNTWYFYQIIREELQNDRYLKSPSSKEVENWLYTGAIWRDEYEGKQKWRISSVPNGKMKLMSTIPEFIDTLMHQAFLLQWE